jgi:dye decolorizing peroxidase
MGCPFHETGSDSETDDESEGEQSTSRDRGVDRREFVKSALAIGGTSALTSLGTIAGVTTTVRAESSDPVSAADRLNRQHAWDAFEPVVGSGNTKPPENSMVLMLEYQQEGEPAAEHRRRVERALGEIERHFEWTHEGLLFTMAYSASYFDRFDADPPAGALPDDADTVVDTVEGLTDLADTNDDIQPDTADAMLLLASDNEANLLATETALWGEGDELTFDATFEDVFEKPEAWPDRHVGFLGSEFQAREGEYEESFLADGDEIPDKAPLSMGHVAGFGASMPEEENVTLKRGQRFPSPDADESAVPTDLAYVGEVGERDPGVFAQGTLKHFAHVELDLEGWYGESDPDRRRHQMYSPYHTEEETNALGGDKPGSGLTEADPDEPNAVGPDADATEPRKTTLEYADEAERTAAGDDEEMLPRDENGDPIPTAGHSQKAARARYDIDGDGEPEQPVLRRDWDQIAPIDDGETASYLFNVPMRFDESIYSLLDANYNIGFTSLDGGIDHDPVEDDRIKERSGIAPFMTATRRGNWLVPPITLRSLPHPQPDEVDVSVSTEEETYVVEASGVEQVVDTGTIRFGRVERVDTAGGATPTDVWAEGGALYADIPAADVDADAGDAVELFLRHEESRKPVVGTTTL